MILLFGSTGYIGSEFKKQLNDRNIDFICCPSAKTMTMEKLKKFYSDLNLKKITCVINAAGYVGKPNVDKCEFEKEDTIHGNILFPQMITDMCSIYDIPILHISTGCIYDGSMNFTEKDEPNLRFNLNNCSFYSGTKVVAEKVVSSFEKHWICRIRIPFENVNNPRNYISKLLNYDCLIDVENSMSNKCEFVSICIDIINNKIEYGIYNITNTGSITTKEVCEYIQKYKLTNKTFKFFKNENEFYDSGIVTAKRSNCTLDNSKLLNTGITISNIHESIEKSIANWID
jgi:dTDP-4-dehydrorhamnose reductase